MRRTIRVTYGLAQLASLIWREHPEYDKRAVLQEIASKYLAEGLFSNDCRTVILNLNGMKGTDWEQDAADLLYGLVLRSAAASSLDGTDAVRKLFTPSFKVNVVDDELDTEEVIASLKKRIKENLADDLRLYGPKIYGAMSDIASAQPDQMQEVYAGLVLKKKIEDGQKVLEIERSAFADEMDTFTLLEALQNLTETASGDNLSLGNLRLFRKSDAVYPQPDCRSTMYSFINGSASRFDRSDPSEEILSSVFFIIKSGVRVDMTGEELRGVKRELSFVCNASRLELLYLAAYLASQYPIFDNIKIMGYGPREFISKYEDEWVPEGKAALGVIPDYTAVYEDGKVERFIGGYEPTLADELFVR